MKSISGLLNLTKKMQSSSADHEVYCSHLAALTVETNDKSGLCTSRLFYAEVVL